MYPLVATAAALTNDFRFAASDWWMPTGEVMEGSELAANWLKNTATRSVAATATCLRFGSQSTMSSSENTSRFAAVRLSFICAAVSLSKNAPAVPCRANHLLDFHSGGRSYSLKRSALGASFALSVTASILRSSFEAETTKLLASVVNWSRIFGSG